MLLGRVTAADEMGEIYNMHCKMRCIYILLETPKKKCIILGFHSGEMMSWLCELLRYTAFRRPCFFHFQGDVFTALLPV
jgi:hypothetical protein